MATITTMATTTTKLSAATTQFASNRILDLPKRQQQNKTKNSNSNDVTASIPTEKRPVIMIPCKPAYVPAMVDVYMSAFSRGSFSHWWPEDREIMRPWSEERFMNRFRDGRSVQFLGVLDGGRGAERMTGKDGEEVPIFEDVVAYAKWALPKPGGSVNGDGEDEYTRLKRAFGLAGVNVGDVAESESTTDKNGDQAGKEEEEEKKNHGDHPAVLPEGVNMEWYREYFGGMGRLGEKYGTDHMLELSLMCTRPSSHGQGIAGAMIRTVLEEIVDPLGIRTVLLALELAAPLYRRLGFVTVEEVGFEKAREEAGETSVMHVMIREPRVVTKNGA